MIGIVLLAAFNFLPIATSAVAGCCVLIASGCLKWRDATQALSVQVILIIVVSLARSEERRVVKDYQCGVGTTPSKKC